MPSAVDQMILDSIGGLPASKKQLKKLGQRLVAGSDDPADWRLYAETIEFFDGLQTVIVSALKEVPWEKVIGRSVELLVVGRAKTLDTLLQKLERTPAIGLASIRDVAGVRIVGDVTLSEQDRIVTMIKAGFSAPDAQVIDRRAEPESGYRAVHVALPIAGVHVEVQIRTRMQHLWAEVFEKLADTWGRQIRYGGDPDPDPDDAAPGLPTRKELIGRLIDGSVELLAMAEEVRNQMAILHAAMRGRTDADLAVALAEHLGTDTLTTEMVPLLPEKLQHPDNILASLEWLGTTNGRMQDRVEQWLVKMLALFADEEEDRAADGYAGEVRDR